MTKREALQVLIRHAARDCGGSGCGISSIPSQVDIEKVAVAIEKVFFDAYRRTLGDSERFNLGIRANFDDRD